MKKIFLASLVFVLVGCSTYSFKNEALSGNEYSNLEKRCHADMNGSIIWQNNVAYCDNGSRTYIISKDNYKDSSPAIFH